MNQLLIAIAQVYTKPSALPSVNADQSFISNAIKLTFAVAGAIALLVITLAGLQYILSQGDPQKTAKAKNTILYAVIGLVLLLLSYTIVSFVTGSLG